ncbi:MAG: LysR family transcriptional regulator [Hyphomicrobiales bacterium]|nr:LysR family transcriptional regulator [Hyphomicrobiales bacterium]
MALKISLRQLEYFNQVARAGSVRKAAEALNVAQPGVTRTIKDLEDLLGVELFARASNGVTLTKFGQILLRHSNAALDEIQSGLDELDAVKDAGEGQIVLAGPTVSMSRILPRAIARLKNRWPMVKVSLHSGTNAQALAALRDGEADIFFGRRGTPDQMQDLHFEPLFQDRLVIVAGAQNPLTEHPAYEIADLIELPWIIPSIDSSFKSFVDQVFRTNDLAPPRNCVEMSFGPSMWVYLEETGAIAAMPSNLVADDIQAGRISILKTDDKWVLPEFGIALRGASRSNRMTGAMVQELRRVALQRKQQLNHVVTALRLG